MRVICSRCQNSMDVADTDTVGDRVVCDSCGASVHPSGVATVSWGPGDARRKVGRFELIESVGSGAFGTVYKARDPELDRIVAVKIPRGGNLGGGELDCFVREARNVARLRHPSIVSVHEVGQQDGVPYLVSDFVEGVTLADLLSARRPASGEAARLVAAVAEALQYAHERGVIHRDV